MDGWVSDGVDGVVAPGWVPGVVAGDVAGDVAGTEDVGCEPDVPGTEDTARDEAGTGDSTAGAQALNRSTSASKMGIYFLIFVLRPFFDTSHGLLQQWA